MALSIRDLVHALGGASVVGAACGISASAVTNWYARDAVATEHHIKVWRMASAAGLDWTPPGAEGLALAKQEAA